MRYKVLWIDDQFDIQTGFISAAFQEDIDITPFKTSADGMRELENNILDYDAVILDAKVYLNSENEVAKLEGLNNSIMRINRLHNIRVIPYFIFTGQPDLMSNATFEEMIIKKPYFKGRDNRKLFLDIKEEADKSLETQIRHRHARVFEVCTEKYIGDAAIESLLRILRSELTGEDFHEEVYFNALRKIIELMFLSANRYGLLHDKCISKEKVNVHASLNFLSKIPDHRLEIACGKKHFSDIVEMNLKYMLDIAFNPGSHINLAFLDHLETTKAPYLLYALTYQLMDILLWFKDYVDKNNDVAHNRSLWTNAEIIHEGEVAQDERGNYYCDEYLLPYKRTHGHFKIGDQIAIYKSSKNIDSRTSQLFLYFADSFEKK